MPKMEEYKRPSVEDLTYMVTELYAKDQKGSLETGEWEQGFIKDMWSKLNAGSGFTENMEMKIVEAYKKHLGLEGGNGKDKSFEATDERFSRKGQRKY